MYFVISLMRLLLFFYISYEIIIFSSLQLTPGGVFINNCEWRHQCHFSELHWTPPSQILDPPLEGELFLIFVPIFFIQIFQSICSNMLDFIKFVSLFCRCEPQWVKWMRPPARRLIGRVRPLSPAAAVGKWMPADHLITRLALILFRYDSHQISYLSTICYHSAQREFFVVWTTSKTLSGPLHPHWPTPTAAAWHSL